MNVSSIIQKLDVLPQTLIGTYDDLEELKNITNAKFEDGFEVLFFETSDKWNQDVHDVCSFLKFAQSTNYLRSNENNPVEKMQTYRVQRN